MQKGGVLMNTQRFPGVGHLLTLVPVCLLLAACSRPAPAPQAHLPLPTPRPNLLRNADLNEGTSHWQAGDSPLSPAVSLGYDQAGYLTIAVDGSTDACAAAWSQTVSVQPGAAYRAAYRARTEALAGSAGMTLSFRDGDGRLLSQSSVQPLAGDSDWTTYAWRVRAPASAAQATVSLGVDGATGGRVAFDEAVLAPDDAPVVRALIVDYGQEQGTLPAFYELRAAPQAFAAVPWAASTGALHLATALHYAQDARLAQAYLAGAGLAAGRLTASDEPGAPAQAWRLLSRLGETPQRLLAQGGDDLGFTILAGRSDDGSLVHVLIADCGSRSQGYRLGLGNFPPGYRYTVYDAAEGKPTGIIAQGAADDLQDGVLALPMHAPAVHLIVLQRDPGGHSSPQAAP
jgi:hypothetical protein